jgi:hypothetical protein
MTAADGDIFLSNLITPESVVGIRFVSNSCAHPSSNYFDLGPRILVQSTMLDHISSRDGWWYGETSWSLFSLHWQHICRSRSHCGQAQRDTVEEFNISGTPVCVEAVCILGLIRMGHITVVRMPAVLKTVVLLWPSSHAVLNLITIKDNRKFPLKYTNFLPMASG